MLHYLSTQLTSLQRYKLLSGSLIPRPIAWVTSQAPNGSGPVNLAPFRYFSTMPSDIPLLTLAIGRRLDGRPKDTAQNILTSEEAVIHLVDQAHLTQMNQTAATLPANQSELSLADFKTQPSRSVSVPSLIGPKVRFETTLYQTVPVQNHEDQIVTDLFILEVTDFYFAEEVLDQKTMHVNATALDPVGRLAGPTYTGLGDLTTLIRPK